MTNFEHMKETVLKTVAALDQEELRRLTVDTHMDEGDNRAVFCCGICEEIFGDCDTLPEGNECMKKYLDWCGRKYMPESGWEDKAEIVSKLEKLLKATRAGSGIDRLDLSEDRSAVIIRHTSGLWQRVNIVADSGYAIIKDVMYAI